MSTFTGHSFDASDVTLHYVEGPEHGPPLLLIHGLTGNHQMMTMPLGEELAKHFHVFAIDLRGHGLSGRTPGKYRFVDYPSDVVAFVDDVIGQPCRIVAHSLGAVIAAQVAAQRSERVKALVLGDPPMYQHERSAAELTKNAQTLVSLLEKRLSQEELEGREHLPPMRARSLSLLDAEAVRVVATDHHADGLDPDSFLRRISCPVLVIRADSALSPAFTDDDQRRLLQAIPSAEVEIVQGASHVIQLEYPEQYLQLALAFLERHSAA